ncbi:GTPase Era [Hathewaya histolytica]|uniref:GTPase Era n=1 Tax=Hathewaya histolytica TaxID=1498 RepID=A0A4U9RNZ7_HATHI|nr:GTPase Era [Hathewaya histolytica]VTQ90580.1 GTP-binding protein Era [Hathewaya histolytica]
MFKSGFVTIIGRPNVGKSTLNNFIMKEKLSIVSSKPQTTRNNIQTILNEKDYQIVFVDTPGVHKPRHKLGEYMVKVAIDALKEVDLVLFITTPEGEIGKADQHILEQLENVKVPKFLLVNKIDEYEEIKLAQTIQKYSEKYKFEEIIPISALKGKNIDVLIEEMKKYIPEGPRYYPEDMVTDRQERFIVMETIREKALRLLDKEVPHGIAVEILSMKQNDKGIYHIEANMLCEKASHKGIIIGKNGATLKRISQYAREDIEKFLGVKVYLRVWVKVKEDWRDSANLLKELGYKE